MNYLSDPLIYSWPTTTTRMSLQKIWANFAGSKNHGQRKHRNKGTAQTYHKRMNPPHLEKGGTTLFDQGL